MCNSTISFSSIKSTFQQTFGELTFGVNKPNQICPGGDKSYIYGDYELQVWFQCILQARWCQMSFMSATGNIKAIIESYQKIHEKL